MAKTDKMSAAEIATARELLDAMKRGDLQLKEGAAPLSDAAQVDTAEAPKKRKLTAAERQATITRALSTLVSTSPAFGDADRNFILEALNASDDDGDETDDNE